jgi:hypothetical protein
MPKEGSDFEQRWAAGSTDTVPENTHKFRHNVRQIISIPKKNLSQIACNCQARRKSEASGGMLDCIKATI